MNRADFERCCIKRKLSLEDYRQAVMQVGGLDYDGAYGVQCCDLARGYCDYVLNIPQPSAPRNAIQWFSSDLAQWFELIKNEPSTVPERGDLVIFAPNAANGNCGHIGIVLEPNGTKDFIIFEQNWIPFKPDDGRTVSDWHAIVGFLRPKKNSTT